MTTQRVSLIAAGGVVAALVGVFSTWANNGPVSLNGTQGPNNGWLVVIFAFVALGGVRALSRGWPEHLALAHVVRVLEQRLRACAAQGGAACR